MSGIIPPGSTIGILGGGQLGRMLAIAAAEMGYHTHIFCPERDAPAIEVAKYHTHANYDNITALQDFATNVEVVTYEFENIPAAPVAELSKHVAVRPGPDVLAVSQHRVMEKQTLAKLGIATAPFVPVGKPEELAGALEKIGTPAVLKTSLMGYDGKGQWKITGKDALPDFTPGEYILEGFVDFSMEISVIVARGVSGDIACYPAVQNIHKNHILSETIAPAPISPELAAKAEQIARTIAEGLKLVGLMAVEMFVTNDGILVNELAPRPHNSGHWTIDACAVSQFEQTIRAICGLPLGSTQRLCDAKMLNLIGEDINGWEKYVAMPNARLHLYGKNESRPGRKMGHVTLLIK